MNPGTETIEIAGGMPAFVARPAAVRLMQSLRHRGRVSYLVACALPDRIAAAAPFYGGGPPIDRTESLQRRLLAFFGEKAPFISLDVVEALRVPAVRLKQTVEVVVYPGAGHGFCCDERSSHDPVAAADAWRRLTALFAAHLGR